MMTLKMYPTTPMRKPVEKWAKQTNTSTIMKCVINIAICLHSLKLQPVNSILPLALKPLIPAFTDLAIIDTNNTWTIQKGKAKPTISGILAEKPKYCTNWTDETSYS